MRIIYYLKTLDIGGTTKTAITFANSMSVDNEVVFVYNADGQTAMLNTIWQPNVKVRCVNNLDQLNNVVAEYKPDIFHVFRSGFPETPLPEVITKAGAKNFVETNIFGLVNSDPYISRVLYMSKWLMDASMISFGLSGDRYDFVNNPVDLPFSQKRLDIGVDSDTIILGRCGRSDPGIYDHINVQGARIAQMMGTKLHFLVVSPPEPMIRQMDEFDISYSVIDPTTDNKLLSEFYNTVDIYCHARADGETFGVNIAEAMIHEKPVITHIAQPKNPNMSVFQSQTELVDDGITGFISPYSNREYAERIMMLANNSDLRKSMGREGGIKAKREYETSKVIGKLRDIYNEITD